ncbi:MAG: hypothetical protein IPL61_00470 [Myxococcales bacterium]|nr:hypothetical protein [Myxococcales bacterium]
MKALVGERRAMAAAVLSFYGFIYVLLGWSAPPEWSALLTAIAGLYAVAFVGVVAGWFWGRWFAQGLGYWGVVSGVLGMWQIGPEPVLVFLTASHAVVSVLLAGEAMAAGFDGRAEWRARFHLDDGGVHRLGKSVVRAAMSLPILIMWALAPSQPSSLVASADLMALLPAGLAVVGLVALVRMRTWGLFALAGAGVAMVALAGVGLVAMIAAALLAAAVAPFARPMARALTA